MEQIAMLPAEEQAAILADMDMDSLIWDWKAWGRPEQQAPTTDWDIWAYIAGRGAGKTRTAAEWVREEAKNTKEGILTKSLLSDDYIQLKETDGNYTGSGNGVWSDYHAEYIDEDDARWCDDIDDYDHFKNGKMYKKYNVLYHSSGVKIELISKFSLLSITISNPEFFTQ
jgi:hypothetical protein